MTDFNNLVLEAMDRGGMLKDHHVKNIGDTDIYANDHFVRVTVDGETVLCFPRYGHGFQEFAKQLYDLS